MAEGTTISSRANRKTLQVVKFVLLLLIGIVLFEGIAWVASLHEVHTLCFARYDKANSCIEIRQKGRTRQLSSPRIEAFLTVRKLDTAGGPLCNTKASATNFLEIPTSVGTLRLERGEDDLLRVNGTPIAKGEEYTKVQVFRLHPWLVSRVTLENLGVVENCQTPVNCTEEELSHFENREDCKPPAQPRLFVLGSSSDDFSPAKGIGILLLLFGGVVIINRRAKRINGGRRRGLWFFLRPTKGKLFLFIIFSAAAIALLLQALWMIAANPLDASGFYDAVVGAFFILVNFFMDTLSVSLAVGVLLGIVGGFAIIYVLSCIVYAISLFLRR
ncbi:hypothetical protein D6779_02440 [Candidatus Parcubacteria bacterium]|nr:MAG: hypothetical protein D6779_02440 [Candidatus Parcubacteria bacterium]